MWSWSRHQSDRATAASFTNWRVRDPEPTVFDPEFSETSDKDGSGTDAGRTPRDGGLRILDHDDAMAEIAASEYARMQFAELTLAGAH
ncbi:hypothetical protein [Nocardia concava]|uniref:hypothetical protein n=1 Tax=Nocardia concava TaxID=257281 RepID=UPI00030B8DC2|nr:hypothetical protein [Nocardia concava]